MEAGAAAIVDHTDWCGDELPPFMFVLSRARRIRHVANLARKGFSGGKYYTTLCGARR